MNNNLITRAARFATESHLGQVRKYTGEHYITHPARVATNISMHPDANDKMVAAAWLHDVVEDCGVSVLAIETKFGIDIAELVEELTNPSKIYPLLSRKDRKQLDLNHIANASNEAKLIKLADRIDNLLEIPLDNEDAKDFLKSVYLKESFALYEVLKEADTWLSGNLLQLLNYLEVEVNGSSSGYQREGTK